MANSNISKSKQKEIKELIDLGRKQGYLTVSAINDLLPNNQYDSDQIEQITKLITDLKIKVVESSVFSSLISLVTSSLGSFSSAIFNTLGQLSGI